MTTQGGKANKAGRDAEDILGVIIRQAGYSYERQKYAGLGIFGNKLFVDFFINDIPQYPAGIIVESKWQSTSGSVDSKLCCLVQNIKECYPCPTVIVLHGMAFPIGGVQWLRRQIDSKLLDVFDRTDGFMKWIRRLKDCHG